MLGILAGEQRAAEPGDERLPVEAAEEDATSGRARPGMGARASAMTSAWITMSA